MAASPPFHDQDRKVWDVIVVGAGAAGCVMAARLSEDSGRSVLLIEAGRDYGTDIAGYPVPLRHASVFTASLPRDAHNWGFVANLRPGMTQMAPRGKLVGGSSALNGALYVRGTPEDFDGWAGRGNDLWSYERVLPTFKALETDLDIQDEWHGSDGPMPIRRLKRADWPIALQAFHQACLNLGHPEDPDMNAPGSTGIGLMPMNNVGGLRMNAAVTFLKPAIGRANLTVCAGAHATRVVFEGTRAIGVEVEIGGKRGVFRGAETVLCAGGIKSPHLLHMSGVGPADLLRSLGIPLVAHSANVGRHASDHCSARITFKAREPHGGVHLERPPNPMSLHFTTSTSKTRDDIEILVNSVPVPQRLIYGLSRMERLRMVARLARTMSPQRLIKQIVLSNHQALSCSLMGGVSRGEVRAASADPMAPPVIDHNFLDDPHDLDRLTEAVEMGMALLRDSAFQQIGAVRTNPLDREIRTRQQLRDWVVANVATGAHLSGTCRMGPETDDTAVVDQQGRVMGVTGLRVADASIMPTITRRGPHPTVLMIGARMADFIKGEARLNELAQTV